MESWPFLHFLEAREREPEPPSWPLLCKGEPQGCREALGLLLQDIPSVERAVKTAETKMVVPVVMERTVRLL